MPSKAAEVYARLVGTVDPNATRLDGPDANLVLNWVIALSLANDTATLTTVRQRFANAMDRGPLREAFGLITNPSEGSLSDFTLLTRRFQELDRAQAFLSSYREKLKNEQLSAINVLRTLPGKRQWWRMGWAHWLPPNMHGAARIKLPACC